MEIESDSLNKHKFEYLVIVDFEASCDEGIHPKVTKENQEIIEFPWIAVNLELMSETDSHRTFVKPQWIEEIPPFCTNLTGITTANVADAPSLSDAIKMFDEYAKLRFGSKSFCFLTDGVWDLKQMLRRECKRKGIELKPHYKQFFDLKECYSAVFKTPPLSLKQMATDLKIDMKNHHSGIADCYTILQILLQILKKGFKFTDPIVIPDSYDPDNDPTFKDFNRTRSLPVIGDASQDKLSVMLRGLPFSATVKDIKKFFHGLNIAPEGISLISANGRPSGMATVKFVSERDVQEALKRHKQYIGNRYIEVFILSECNS